MQVSDSQLGAATLNASFGAALAAARAVAGHQHYPQATLYVVATPIGNLADMTLRALHVLALADAIACEDTRHTRQLLHALGMARPAHSLLALHQHNECEAARAVLARLQRGERVAYVSDAGTPAISDPGARLVATVRDAGLRVLPLPGASSLTTALSAAGVVDESGFVFAGFLPAKTTERQQALRQLAAEPRCTVLLEAPHRIAALADALATLGQRPVTLARELTKQFEQIVTLPATGAAAWLAADAQRQRGEFVVIVHAAPLADDGQHAHALRVLHRLLPELPLKTAVKLAADITGAPRKLLYAAALAHARRDDTA